MRTISARPRRRVFTQLWFWVLVAISAGAIFGLVAPDQALGAKWLADAFLQLVKTIDKAVKTGALHRNTGARKKSRAARLVAGQPSA